MYQGAACYYSKQLSASIFRSCNQSSRHSISFSHFPRCLSQQYFPCLIQISIDHGLPKIEKKPGLTKSEKKPVKEFKGLLETDSEESDTDEEADQDR